MEKSIIIKGIVTQIIKPNKIRTMIANSIDLPIRHFDNSGLYILSIVDEDYPSNFFKRYVYAFKNRKREWIRTLAMADAEHIRVGDYIEAKARMYRIPTRMYINKTAQDGYKHRHKSISWTTAILIACILIWMIKGFGL